VTGAPDTVTDIIAELILLGGCIKKRCSRYFSKFFFLNFYWGIWMNTLYSRILNRGLLLFTIFFFAFVVSLEAAHIFKPWHDDVYVAVGRDHGPKAEKRIRTIMDMVAAYHDKPVMEKLKLTNDFLNNIQHTLDCRPGHLETGGLLGNTL
jgi:hypothetical protein